MKNIIKYLPKYGARIRNESSINIHIPRDMIYQILIKEVKWVQRVENNIILN